MKNIIKLLGAVILLTVSMGSYAQIFGVKAGLNLSNMLLKDDEDTYSDDFKMKIGYHAGLTAEFPIAELFSFETGLLLATKGFKVSEEENYMGETEVAELRTSLLYLDVPLTAKVYFDLGGAKIYGAFGPYVGIGLSGKNKYEFSYAGETEKEEEDIEWGENLNRLDFGLTAGAGIEISSVQVGLNYNLGLANISSDTSNGEQVNNRVVGVSVGYKFGGK